MSVGKAIRLLEEAREDLKVGSYDKAVSAAYFSVRMLAEVYLKDLRTRKDDKIANALGRKLGEDTKKDFLYLFERRKEADHRDKIFTKKEAEEVLDMAESLFNKIMDSLHS